MSNRNHGVTTNRKALSLARPAPEAPRITKTISGFGGIRDGHWVETVPADYTPAEVAVLQQLVREERTNEAAWIHGLKAAFRARLVVDQGDGTYSALEAATPAYEQGALL